MKLYSKDSLPPKVFLLFFYTAYLEFPNSESPMYPEIAFWDNSSFQLHMQQHIVLTLDYPKSTYISLEQARLNQATQVKLITTLSTRVILFMASILSHALMRGVYYSCSTFIFYKYLNISQTKSKFLGCRNIIIFVKIFIDVSINDTTLLVYNLSLLSSVFILCVSQFDEYNQRRLSS